MAAPIAIIGAGPAGLACARRLAEAALPVIVIDDNAQGGGQYFRQLPPAFRAVTAAIERDQTRAEKLLEILSHPLVTHLPDTTVWALPEPTVLAHAGAHGSGRIVTAATVVAAGAYDRSLPFPGWTLPGVITAGGCLNLVKGQGIVPGSRVAVVGNGPLLLVVSYTLLRLGVEIAVVAEAASSATALRHGVGLSHSPKLLLKGLAYRATIARSGAPFLDRHVVVRAVGGSSVAAVIVAPIGPDGMPVCARQRRFAVDAVVAGYGLAPSIEVTRLFGCRHIFDPGRGGWIPARNAALETSVPGVFAIGDCAGIGGVEIALLEAEIAAEALIRRFGKPVGRSAATTKLRRLDRFRDALNACYRTLHSPWLAEDATVICRCEEITVAEFRAAAQSCGHDLKCLKTVTRLSMGRCQGRNCLASAAALLARDTGRSAGDFPLPRPRPPARPVPIAQLLEETLGPPRTPDQVEFIFEARPLDASPGETS